MPEGAVIAGGAVRDWYLDIEPKDIDVFVGPSQSDQCLDSRYGLCRIDNYYERREEYEAMNEITLVSRGRLFGYTIDVVELIKDFTPKELIETFDFGISRCFYAEGVIYYAPEAVKDLFNKTVTLLLNDRPERSAARFARFNERMGGGWSYRA